LGAPGTFKVKGKNNDASKGIFIGVARESDLMSYLRNVENDEIINVSIHTWTANIAATRANAANTRH
jgi:hypothetical protein